MVIILTGENPGNRRICTLCARNPPPMDGPEIEPGPTWRDDVGLTVHATFNVQEGRIYCALKGIVSIRFGDYIKTTIGYRNTSCYKQKF